MLDRVVSGLVALGVPGFVLLVALEVTGLTGAAAITAALAFLGGPAGMLGGIGVLVLLALASRALARYGLSRVAKGVVRGLITKGESKESIRTSIEAMPSWIISSSVRAKAQEALNENPA